MNKENFSIFSNATLEPCPAFYRELMEWWEINPELRLSRPAINGLIEAGNYSQSIAKGVRSEMARLFNAADIRPKKYLFGHGKRNAFYTSLTNDQLIVRNKPHVDPRLAAWGGFFHDLGKSDPTIREIISKTVHLTPEDIKIVKKHTSLGAEMFRRLYEIDRQLQVLLTRNELAVILDAIRYHHERMDGRGNEGLPAEKIPLIAKIVATSDVMDVVGFGRFYCDAHTTDFTLEEAKRSSGQQWDDVLVQRKMGQQQLDPTIVNATIMARPRGNGDFITRIKPKRTTIPSSSISY